jgi:3'-5' exoribonuclease 1
LCERGEEEERERVVEEQKKGKVETTTSAILYLCPFFLFFSLISLLPRFTMQRYPSFDYLTVVDIEATCGKLPGITIGPTQQEVIELPCVVVDSRRAEIISEYDSLVRPTELTRLTPFCTRLTGLTQADVDGSWDLAAALVDFDWFVRGACSGGGFCIVTDGRWDVETMLTGECARKGIQLERYWKRYFDVRTEFADLYYPGFEMQPIPLLGMLSDLGMTFEGRRHRGIDDARNIARVVCRILRDDWASRVNTNKAGMAGSFTAPVLLPRAMAPE